MLKFAYLIMIHENTLVLRTLLKLIDDERNDIFIHVDTKCDLDFREELLQCLQKSKLYFTSKRVDVKWAHISQVEAEYVLFEQAFQKRKYAYYHLLSGSDLPIKSQNHIYDFLLKNKGKEFVAFTGNALPDRVKYIHLFPERFRNANRIENTIRKLFIYAQKLLGFSSLKSKKNWEIKKGTNWASVTDSFVNYLLKHKPFVMRVMKYAKSPDEHYKQILVFNSEFRDRIYSLEDEFDGCMRLIDWERGKPYNWQEHDVSEILSSNKLFARKFTDENERLIINLEDFIRNA